MEILEVNASEYNRIIPNPYHVFGSAAFNEHNKGKCDRVHYLLFKDSKYRLGLVGGVIDQHFYSPYSAPYGGFSFLSEEIRLNQIDECIEILNNWANQNNISSINLTLPPPFYNESFVAKQTNCLFRNHFRISKIDLNYSFQLDSLDENYIKNIWHNSRKNLNIALRSGLSFIRCKTNEEREQAYEILITNRVSKGFQLSMTWEEVKNTILIIKSDFFIVLNELKEPVASAIVFQVTPIIVQVIYWGNLPEYTDLKPMNFLSYKVFEFYKQHGMMIMDIGPSTTNSIPNNGLCEFKEGIGCDISVKTCFTKEYIIHS